MTLQVSNISKTYKNGKEKQILFENLSICFARNGLVGIVGSSGTGKSTLLNIIAGIEKADTGSIMIDLQELQKANFQTLANYRKEYVSFIYQYYNMIEALTIKENILLAMDIKQSMKNEDKILQYAKQLEIAEILDRLPSKASGGQKQKAAFLRAMLCQSPILLADEPTGALHQKHRETIMKMLKEYAKKHLVIVVSHDVDLLKRYTSQIIDLDSPNKKYDFSSGELYPQCILLAKNHGSIFYRIQYIYRQMFHHRHKLSIMFISQMFTIISFSLLLSAKGGIEQHFTSLYQGDPGKNIVEIQKNDYIQPEFTKAEYEQLSDKRILHKMHKYDLSVGSLGDFKELEYFQLPKQTNDIKLISGTVPDEKNEICISEKFALKHKIKVGQIYSYMLANQSYDFFISGIIQYDIANTDTVFFDYEYLDEKLQQATIDKKVVYCEMENTDIAKTFLKQIDTQQFYAFSNHLDMVEGYQSLMTLGSFVAVLFILVSFIVSMILMSIVLSTMLIQRRKDSALLLVFGFNKGQLRQLFTLETVCITLGIAFVGSLFSCVVISICNAFNLFSFISDITPLFVISRVSLCSIMLIVYFIIGLFLATLSSYTIGKMNISQLLKEE